MERSVARGNVYSLLSLCFTYPDDEIYGCIAQGEWLRETRESLHLLADDHFEACLGIFEDVCCGGGKAVQREMAGEYTRLLINAYPRTVHLQGSTCRGEDVPVSEENTPEILRFFHEAGFIPSRGDIPGHISHQLEFMGVLAKRESAASRGGRIRLEEIQLDFLSHFLITGVSAYRERVKNECCFPFYCILGDLTQEFMSFEINYLGIPEEEEHDRWAHSHTCGS